MEKVDALGTLLAVVADEVVSEAFSIILLQMQFYGVYLC